MAYYHFWIRIIVSPSRLREEKCLVNCDACEYFQVFLEWPFYDHTIWFFGIWKSFVWCYGWFFHVKEVNIFHVVSFDPIKFHLNNCFKLKIFCFNFSANSVVDTRILKPFLKGCGNCRNMVILVIVLNDIFVVVYFGPFLSYNRCSISDFILISSSCFFSWTNSVIIVGF